MYALMCVVMTTGKQWSAEMVHGIAEAARRRRAALGLSAAEVSKRTEVGKSLSRAVISDLETGRKRTLDVSELVTLAKALDCSPLSLLFPDALDEVEVLPGVAERAVDALGWWTGVRGVTEESARDEGIRAALDIVRAENALKLHRAALESVERSYRLSGNEFERQRADESRAYVEWLEADRQRSIETYRNATEGPGTDA